MEKRFLQVGGRRALVAVAAGLALAGAPAAYVLAATPTVAAAATQANVKSVTPTTNAELTSALEDDSVTEINLTYIDKWIGGGGNWTATWNADGYHIKAGRNLTINGVAYDRDNEKTLVYLVDTMFVVDDGASLTFNNVNIDDSEASGKAQKDVVVQPGGTFTTKGVGDIVTNGGTDEGAAIQLVSSYDANKKAVATLGAAPSGFMAGAHSATSWSDTDGSGDLLYQGNYGGTYCVTAGYGSELTITDGRFIVENGKYQAIQSYGTVRVEPTDDSYFNNNGNMGFLGSVLLNGKDAKLIANDASFGYNDPGDVNLNVDEEQEVKATLQLDGGARAYLTDSSVADSEGQKLGKKSAVWVDKDSIIYEQEKSAPDAQTFSTQSSYPSFTNFKTVFSGDHAAQGNEEQYSVQGLIRENGNTVDKAQDATRGLYQVNLKSGQSVDDLESLVNADSVKLNTSSDEVSGDNAVLTAPVEVGKNTYYGMYELKHNETTGISNDPAGSGKVIGVSAPHVLQAGWDLSQYRGDSGNKAPEAGAQNTSAEGDVVENDTLPQGSAFGGWYQDAALTKPVDKATKNGYAYLKVIDADELKGDVKFLGGALRMDTKTEGYKTYDKADFRMVYTFKAPEGTTLDTTKGTGWKYTVLGKTYEFYPDELNKVDQNDGSAWAALQLMGMPKSAFTTNVTTTGVLGYTTADGTDVQVDDPNGQQTRSAEDVAKRIVAPGSNAKNDEKTYAQGLLDALKNN